MARKKSHKKMTSAEQARLSEDIYGSSSYSNSNSSSNYNSSRSSSSRSSNSANYGYEPLASTNYASQQSAKNSNSKKSRRSSKDSHTSRSEGASDYYSSRRKKKGHNKVLRVFLIILVVLLVGVVGIAAAYVLDINSNLSSGVSDNLRENLVASDSSEPYYVLILGVDKSDEREESWGEDTSNYRADTIILARIDAENQAVTLVSIPRDTAVDMGDYGTQKINAAYALGGGAYMTEIVSELAGVDISHYAEIDFEQFISIVDTIGGIEVTLTIDVIDEEYAGINLTAGTYTLDGETALALVRTRHAYDDYGSGDYYRTAVQRMVIGAILEKILSLDTATMTTTISELAESVTTDYTVTELLTLATQFADFDLDTGFYTGMLPTISSYEDGVWYELVDEDAWATMMERVENGESPYADESEDITASVLGSVGTYTGDDDTTTTEDVTATFTGSVLVLNGTDTTGLALNTANTLISAGFSATADNADSDDVSESAIIYNNDDYSDALGVAETLELDDSIIMENDGTYSTDYDIVIVLGADFEEDDEDE